MSMRTYNFKVVVEPDEDFDGNPSSWHAYCPVLETQGASTWGATEAEALKNIDSVVHLVVASLLEHGRAFRVLETLFLPSTQEPILTYSFALPSNPGYCKGMPKVKIIDPFVSNEPAVEISPATSRLLKQRMKTADEGRLVPADKARQRIHQWLSKSSTTKTR